LNIIISDFYIISKIWNTNIYDVKVQEVINKKVWYVNSFRKIKKAFNITLNIKYDKKLINIIISFIE